MSLICADPTFAAGSVCILSASTVPPGVKVAGVTNIGPLQKVEPMDDLPSTALKGPGAPERTQTRGRGVC